MKRLLLKMWIAAFSLSALVMPFTSVVASAATPLPLDNYPYVFYYPKDSASDLKAAARDSSIGDSALNGVLSKTYIYTNGGPLGVQQLPINKSFSNKQDKPIYSLDYYCTDDGKIGTTKPDGSANYIRLTFAVEILDWSDSKILGGSYSTRVGSLGNSEVGTYHSAAHPDTSPTGASTAYPSRDYDIDGHGGDNDLRTSGTVGASTTQTGGIPTYNVDQTTRPGSPSEQAVNQQINKCTIQPNGAVGHKTGNYQASSPADQQAFDAKLSAANLGDNANAAAANSSTNKSSATNQNCTGGSFGWLLCPAINYMAQAIQFVAGLIDNLLTVRFLSSQSGGTSIEGIWRAILSVANIMLVIAFMFLIISQTSSQGMSNYGIKKMLPRLIIAAILMNLSFYICALLIDFSNIIGASVMGFLLGANNNISESVASVTGGDNGFLYSAGQGAATAAIGVGLVILVVCLFAPILLFILAVFVAIIGRQVVLLVLVLVSPLAFVAWVLPNTEKYFKQWWSMFFELLVLYPIVMVIFGAGLLLSNLLGSAGDSIRFGN